jgi:GNAT superfamily N-acetyltransferase
LITHFLGEQEVTSYCRDLAKRLSELGDEFPTLWIPLGESGWKMHKHILDALQALQVSGEIKGDFVSRVEISKADYDRAGKSISFDPSLEKSDVLNKVALAIDSAVHTGSSMLALIAAMRAAGLSRILSYALVLKNSARFIPTYFSVVIPNSDRAYFDLKSIPNNRLFDLKGNPPPKILDGVLRVLDDADADKIIEVGDPLGEVSVSNLLYEREINNAYVYGYEETVDVAGKIGTELTGYINFRKLGHTLFIDAVGVKFKSREAGIATALLRWTETWGRSSKCSIVEVWAYEKLAAKLEDFGFTPVDGELRPYGPGQKFKLMRKPLLYNVRLNKSDYPHILA